MTTENSSLLPETREYSVVPTVHIDPARITSQQRRESPRDGKREAVSIVSSGYGTLSPKITADPPLRGRSGAFGGGSGHGSRSGTTSPLPSSNLNRNRPSTPNRSPTDPFAPPGKNANWHDGKYTSTTQRIDTTKPHDNYDPEKDPFLHPELKKKQGGLRRFLYKAVTCCGFFQGIGENIKSILYGGLDGITSVFVSVATIYSAQVSIVTVLIVGVAKLISGGISMGMGDFMSSKAEQDLIKHERKRELWECDNYMEGEVDEMIDIYSDKGIERDVADELVSLMSRNKEAFVDVMMVQELGLKAKHSRLEPFKNGLTNFTSFILFGSVPLLIYIIFLIVKLSNGYRASDNLLFFTSCGITLVALVIMGIMKSRFGTENMFLAVFTTLVVGVVAAGSGYLVAFALDKLFGFKE